MVGGLDLRMTFSRMLQELGKESLKEILVGLDWLRFRSWCLIIGFVLMRGARGSVRRVCRLFLYRLFLVNVWAGCGTAISGREWGGGWGSWGRSTRSLFPTLTVESQTSDSLGKCNHGPEIVIWQAVLNVFRFSWIGEVLTTVYVQTYFLSGMGTVSFFNSSVSSSSRPSTFSSVGTTEPNIGVKGPPVSTLSYPRDPATGSRRVEEVDSVKFSGFGLFPGSAITPCCCSTIILTSIHTQINVSRERVYVPRYATDSWLIRALIAVIWCNFYIQATNSHYTQSRQCRLNSCTCTMHHAYKTTLKVLALELWKMGHDEIDGKIELTVESEEGSAGMVVKNWTFWRRW